MTPILYAADTAPLTDQALFKRLYPSLPPERKARLDRLSADKEKRLSLAAFCLLKTALHERGIKSFSLAAHPSGKPYLADHKGLFFSLSHSGERALCALSTDEVGCDVEQIRPIDPALAQRFFVRSEADRLLALAGEEAQMELFFRLWTLKESLSKAIGLDLVTVMRGIESRESRGSFTFSHGLHTAREIRLEEGYSYALCSTSEEEPVIRWVDLTQ